MKIWVYAIAKNERKFCDRFMASCAGADGVSVLDTGSNDGTPERLHELGADVGVVTVSPWRFDTARNIALEMVPDDVDVCVSLDLDEVLSPGWREDLERDWALCRYWAMRALEIKERDNNYITDPEAWGAEPYDLVALSNWQLGHYDDALAAAEAALACQPDDERLRRNAEIMRERAGGDGRDQ